MVEKKEATRIARVITVGGKTHRLAIVLEAGRSEGRHYIDDICVAPSEFDRIVEIAMMPET